MLSDELKRRISAGRGDALADLVLKNARIVNVFTDEIDTADIAISGNSIVGVGTYHGRKEVDLHGKYVCPGLIDGHIHIESSMLCGPAFEHTQMSTPASISSKRILARKAHMAHAYASMCIETLTEKP